MGFYYTCRQFGMLFWYAGKFPILLKIRLNVFFFKKKLISFFFKKWKIKHFEQPACARLIVGFICTTNIIKISLTNKTITPLPFTICLIVFPVFILSYFPLTLQTIRTLLTSSTGDRSALRTSRTESKMKK